MVKKAQEQEFLRIVADHHDLLAKVCFLYSDAGAPFEDLYQEVLANVWQGMSSFRGDAKISTWLYRTAINTCLTWHRRNRRHEGAMRLEDLVSEPVAGPDTAEFLDNLRQLHALISRLEPLEKAIITMWLDEKPYEEISEVTGLGKNALAVRLHRIKAKLAKMADDR